MKARGRIALAGWAVMLAAPALEAQQSTQLSGLIRDPSGATVQGAAIAIVHDENGFRRTAQSQSDGGYVIASLYPGSYKITVRKEGFRTAVRFGVPIEVAQPGRADFILSIGSMHDSVTVESAPAGLQSENASIGTLVSRRWIDRMPLSGRGLLGLIELAPGAIVTPATRGEAGQFTVNGQRPNSHYFTVDGLSVNSAVIAGGQPAQSTGGSLPAMTAFGSFHNLFSLEALEEFRVQTSTVTPEYGRLPGAQVSLNTRAGSNWLHGSLYYFLRHEKLDANDWFANRHSLEGAPQRLHDLGAALGGPILRNRLFFFASYEQVRMRQPFVWRAASPAIEARRSAPPWAQSALDLFPEPNGPALTADTAEWLGQSNRPARAGAAGLRLDYAPVSRALLFARIHQAPSWNEFGGFQVNQISMRSRMITAGATVTVTPRVIEEFRAGHSRARLASSWSQDRGRLLPDCFWQELASLFQPAPCDAFFRFSIGGLGQLASGRETGITQEQWNLTSTLTFVPGSHQIRIGGDWRQIAPARARAASSLDVMADSLLDFTSRRNLWITSTNLAASRALLREWSAFAQDTWRASPSLTFTFGLRWELNPPPGSRERVYGVDESGPFRNPGELGLWQASYRNLAPRASAAWRLGSAGHSVLRAGFGLYFNSSLDIATDAVNGAPSSLWQFASPQPEASGPARTLLTYGVARDLQLPRVWQWNVALEHGFSTRGVASLAYAGTVGRRLLRREIRGRESPNLVQVALGTNHGSSDSHSMQAQYRGRLPGRVEAILSYSWAHTLDTGSADAGIYWTGTTLSASSDRASADFDIRHAFSAALSWDSDRLAPPSLRRWFGGWSIDSIWRARTGFPIDVLTSERAMGIGFANVFRADRVAGRAAWIADRAAPGGRRLNPGAFRAAPPLTQGSLGRNAISGFGMSQLDLALRREFALGRSNQVLQLGVEAFNALNRANFADPVRYLVSPLFGQAASMLNGMLASGTPASGLAPMLQTGGARSVQVSLRVRF